MGRTRNSPDSSTDPVADVREEVERYRADVLDGTAVVGELIRLAVAREAADLADAGRGPWVFDWDQAARYVRFIECGLKLFKGEFEGRPFALEPWQKWIVAALFGWRERSTGLRRYREAYISIGRGNGKSPLAAAILLCLCCCDDPPEPRAEIKIASTQKGSEDDSGAAIVFNEIRQQIAGNPTLKARFTLTEHAAVYEPLRSSIQPLSGKGKTKDGFNLHAFVADELHEWGKEHKPLWSKLLTATGKRRQPLAVSITTAGSDRSALWLAVYKRVCSVVRGASSDPRLFAAVYQIDDPRPDGDGGMSGGDDPRDPAVWAKANPNLGVSVRREYLERLAAQAEDDPEALHDLTRYHCNRLVRSTLKPVNLALWAACGEEPIPDLTGRKRYSGLDLGWGDDLAAAAWVTPLGGRRYAAEAVGWVPEQTPHHKLDRAPWAQLIASGKLRVTPGDITDPESIEAEYKRRLSLHATGSVALDPNNARATATALTNTHGLEVFYFSQSATKYHEPLRELLAAVREVRLYHGGCPLLSFAMANLAVRKNAAGLSMPDKESSDEKIDPAVALLMAFSEAIYHEREAEPVYNQRGLRTV